MNIITTTLLIVSIILVVAEWYFCIYRNNRVLKLSLEIIDLCAEYNYRIVKSDPSKYGYDLSKLDPKDNAFEWFDKYSYHQMIFSFKPLKLEAWYTQEEINKIKGN